MALGAGHWGLGQRKISVVEQAKIGFLEDVSNFIKGIWQIEPQTEFTQCSSPAVGFVTLLPSSQVLIGCGGTHRREPSGPWPPSRWSKLLYPTPRCGHHINRNRRPWPSRGRLSILGLWVPWSSGPARALARLDFSHWKSHTRTPFSQG